jgi:predicted RNA binding protein YcfA (HicA-like mRNA interferase family)
MPKLKRLSASDVVSALQHFGFFILTQRGSHINLRRISRAGEK